MFNGIAYFITGLIACPLCVILVCCVKNSILLTFRSHLHCCSGTQEDALCSVFPVVQLSRPVTVIAHLIITAIGQRLTVQRNDADKPATSSCITAEAVRGGS